MEKKSNRISRCRKNGVRVKRTKPVVLVFVGVVVVIVVEAVVAAAAAAAVVVVVVVVAVVVVVVVVAVVVVIGEPTCAFLLGRCLSTVPRRASSSGSG